MHQNGGFGRSIAIGHHCVKEPVEPPLCRGALVAFRRWRHRSFDPVEECFPHVFGHPAGEVEQAVEGERPVKCSFVVAPVVVDGPQIAWRQ